jgi:uncharacterized membrane protein
MLLGGLTGKPAKSGYSQYRAPAAPGASVKGMKEVVRQSGDTAPAAALLVFDRMKTPGEIAAKLLGVPFEQLDDQTRKVASHVAQRLSIARNTVKEYEDAATFGQRAADTVALFGGSWTFIGLFMAVLVVWVCLNTFILASHRDVFDPYPFILLNLFLSMLAAIQAPIILMSQNRHAEKDRLDAAHDYEVNLKAELEIMMLHEKMDVLRQQQWTDLLALQKEQLQMLQALSATSTGGQR